MSHFSFVSFSFIQYKIHLQSSARSAFQSKTREPISFGQEQHLVCNFFGFWFIINFPRKVVFLTMFQTTTKIVLTSQSSQFSVGILFFNIFCFMFINICYTVTFYLFKQVVSLQTKTEDGGKSKQTESERLCDIKRRRKLCYCHKGRGFSFHKEDLPNWGRLKCILTSCLFTLRYVLTCNRQSFHLNSHIARNRNNQLSGGHLRHNGYCLHCVKILMFLTVCRTCVM